MQTVRKSFFCLLVIFIPLFGYSQITPPLLRTLTVEDGLPQGFISGIVQDTKGFIWIGTRNGLARYDGRKFRTFYYSPGQRGGLSSGIITYIWIDETDNLWIFYESGDLDVFSTKTEKVVALTAKKEFTSLKGQFKRGRSFVETKDNYLILTRTGKIYAISKSLEKLVHVPHHDPILGIAAYHELIVLTTERELVFLNQEMAVTKTAAIPYDPPKLNPSTVAARENSAIIRNKELVIIDHSRIIIYNVASGKFRDIPLPAGTAYYFSPSVRLIDTHGTIYFDLEGHGRMALDSRDKLHDWNINMHGRPYLLDRSGVLWAGTGGHGIEQFDMRISHLIGQRMKTGFHTEILEKAGVSDHRVKQFIDTISGYGWRWHYASNQNLFVAQSEPGSKTSAVFYLDRHNKVHYPKWKVNSGDSQQAPICAFAEDATGQLWGVGRDMRLYTFDPERQTITLRYAMSFDIGNPFVNEINGLTAHEGGFWISSNLGLFQYDIVTNNTKRYLQDFHVLSLLDDPVQKGILWVGTMYGGLLKFSTKTKDYTALTTDDGLPNNTVYAILPDHDGNLWCSTNKGIFSFSPDGNKIRKHSVHGEISVVEFNRHHFFKFPDGNLAFGGPDGYVIFNPALILEDKYRPETLITCIAINNKKMKTGSLPYDDLELLTLSYDENFLVVEFAAPEYNAPDGIQYRYRMKGLDKDWVYTGNGNTATYTTIPPGDYELLINCTNAAGQWSSKVKMLHITINPPFWETAWFIIAATVVGCIGIYLLIRKRINDAKLKYQLEVDNEREAIKLEAKALRAQMNPHFIFNCLSSIKALIHTDQKKDALIYLTTFAKLLRNQLNSNLLEVTLHDELQTCELYLKLESQRFKEKLEYEFSIDPSLDCHDIKIPALLIQPFIENAIIHGLLPLPGGGKITVSVHAEDDLVTCKIDDNGIGRNAKVKMGDHESKGISLVRGRLNLYNQMHEQDGRIEIIDRKNGDGPSGTLVVITLYL